MKTSLASAIVAVALASNLAVGRQEAPGPKPPKELKAIGWLKGSWDADFKMYENGKATGDAKGPITTGDALGNMYIESRFETDMAGMKMLGLQLTSYDSVKKEYMAYWFDSMAPGVLELRGKLKGQTLVMTSKPTSFPGMPGKMAFRSTNSVKSATTMLFRLEMNTGKGWGKMMEGTMTRK